MTNRTPQTRPEIKTPRRRRDGWTPELMALFLRTLGSTQSVTEAAKAVGKSRQSAYALRQQLMGEPFGLAWEIATDIGLRNLEQVALDRAINGVEVPHYYKGELIGTSKRYNEPMTKYLLAARGVPKARSAGTSFASNRFDDLMLRVTEGSPYWSDQERALSEDAKIEADALKQHDRMRSKS